MSDYMVKARYLVFTLILIGMLVGSVLYFNYIGHVEEESKAERNAEQQMNEYNSMSEEEKEESFISGSYDDYNSN